MILRRLLLAPALSAPLVAAAAVPPGKGMPVAVFHGMTASASFEDGEIDFLSKALGPSWQFMSIPYAENAATISTSIQKQSENACQILQNTEPFKSAEEISLIGHSNGGMVSRWVLQNCQINEGRTRIAYYISVGGPQRGITRIPRDNMPTYLLPLLDWIVKKAYLWSWVQELIGPAGYVYNPMDMGAFRQANTFLGKLNNENEISQRDFKQRERVAQLDGMLLIQFQYDTVVEPKESEWFAQVAADGQTLMPVEDSGEFWNNDTIGIRSLHDQGKLFFATAYRNHDELEDEDRARWMVPLLTGEKPPANEKNLVHPLGSRHWDEASKLWDTVAERGPEEVVLFL